MTSKPSIQINLKKQSLILENGSLRETFSVSTARNGPGERINSECTPRGRHIIRLKIGHECPVNTVFAGRRPTGEIYSPTLAKANPDRDWILTRILWLTGKEPGLNRGGDRDTLKRYIYIHGCPDEEPMGVPLSHGCIRMRNEEVIRLFDMVTNGTEVEIKEG